MPCLIENKQLAERDDIVVVEGLRVHALIIVLICVHTEGISSARATRYTAAHQMSSAPGPRDIGRGASRPYSARLILLEFRDMA